MKVAMNPNNSKSTVGLLIVISVLNVMTVQAQSVIFVDQSAAGTNNGASWDDAFVFLQDALSVAQTMDEIWVGTGTYRPDVGASIALGDREASFVIPAGVALYGGFSGVETSRDQRDWEMNETILSGDLLDNDVVGADPFGFEKSDNSLNIVYIGVPTTEPAPNLDGFSISGGNATINGSDQGSGLIIDNQSHVLLTNLLFRDNFSCRNGGAMFSRGTFSLTNALFQGNELGFISPGCSGEWGGALTHWPRTDSDKELEVAMIRNVVFESNFSAQSGGALAVVEGPIVVINSSFINNRAVDEGGAAYNLSVPESSPAFYINVEFIGNSVIRESGGIGGAMSIDDSAVEITNALFNGNYVHLPGGSVGSGGAIVAFERNSRLVVSSATFVNNSAKYGSAVFQSISANVEIWNSILWDNPSVDGMILWAIPPSTIPIGFSLIEGGLQPWFDNLGGILDAKPDFVDPTGLDGIVGTRDDDYRLLSSSPGIDSGNNLVLPSDLFDLDMDGDQIEPIPFDLNGEARVQNGGTGNLIIDMGAFEFNAIVEGIENPIPDPNNSPEVCGELFIYPNPAHNSLRVEFRSGIFSASAIRIYDAIGRLILTIDTSNQPNGPREIDIPIATLPSGPYLLRAVDTLSQTYCSSLFVKSS